MNNKEYKMLLSSKKLTFSLASLIVVMLALGFAFWTTPVMAHPHLDDPDTTNVDESANIDHEESHHPMATIELIPANDASFAVADNPTIRDSYVRLLNAAAVDHDNDGTTDDIVIGGRFVEIRDTDTAATPVITQDANGLFKLRITFSRDLDTGTAPVVGDITLTAVGSTTPRLDTTTTNWLQTPAFVTDDATTTDIDESKRVIEVEVFVPSTAYSELPITVYVSVNATVVAADGSITSGLRTPSQVIAGRPVDALGVQASVPLDAMFTVISTGLPENDAPTLAITHAPADGAALPASGDVTFTFTFTDASGIAATGAGAFTTDDIAVTGGTKGAFAMTSNLIYTLAVTPTTPNTDVMVSVTAGSVTDAAAIPNALAADASLSETWAAPVAPVADTPITITPSSMIKSVGHGTGEIGPSSTSVMFTLAATKTPEVKVERNGAELTKTDYSLTATGTDNEHALRVLVNAVTNTVKVTAAAGFELKHTDPDSNAATPVPTAIDDFTVTVDRDGPEVMELVVSGGLPADGGATRVKITFDEGIASAPTATNFTVTNGTIGDFIEVDDKTYIATVTPAHGVSKDATDTMKQSVEIRLNAGVMDEHGNPSVATAADADADGSFMPNKATTAPIVDAAFTSATPASGNIGQSGTISVVFDKDPGVVTITGATITTSGATRTITVPATQAAGALTITLSWGTSGTKTLTYTVTIDQNPTTPANIQRISVPGDSYVILVRDKAAAIGTSAPLGQEAFQTLTKDLNQERLIPDANIIEWANMPNLANLFNRNVTGGGALVLRKSVGDTAAPAVGTVGISEIMWALDTGFPNQAMASSSQWIEIHNLNAETKTVLIYAQERADILNSKNIVQATQAGDEIHGKLGDAAATTMVVDVVTNVFNGSNRGSAGWVVPGSNGASTTGINFVSMARIPKRGSFNLTRHHENNSGKPLDGLYNNAKGAENSLDGRASGSWAAATTNYDEMFASQLGNVVREYYFVGTPGRPNTHSVGNRPLQDARTDVPASPIIINEIANRLNEDNEYEWIELRNVGTGEVNLNNYNISILTSADNDKPFIYLPNNNNAKIPAGGVLLLVDSDPHGDPDHPLAVGWNVAKNAEDQVPGLDSLGINATSAHGRYLVVQFGVSGSDHALGLPDTGNFVLIVRRPDNHDGGNDGGKGRAEFGKDDLDKINDVAGHASNLAKSNYTNDVSSTSFWPLKSQGGPDDRNKITHSKVRRRQHVTTRDGRAGSGNTHNDRKPEHLAFRDVGYTGIGYKRQAANNNIHGGTPGYSNGAQKGKVLDLAMNKLVISEIMLSQGSEDARTKLPQWIEIYNPSPHPVSLGGWRLIIENPRDPIRTINLGSGSVKTILSEQTILVVSGSARDIGSDTLPAATVFPATRVYNVYQHQRNEFDMTSRFDPILDEEAFHITLIDGTALDTSKADQQPDVAGGKHLRLSGKYYAISDTVGNLDGDPRTNDTPETHGKMKFEKGMTADGERTSLIRIFDEGVARDGTGAVKPLGGTAGVGVARMRGVDDKYSWVHAADTEQRLVRHTWYGDESDWGTPADRAGQILPVQLSHFRPTLEDGKVTIRWTTESELDNAGFNILRSDTRDGEFKQVNAEMIQGHGTTGERHTYKWVDESAKPNVVYYYQIEDVSFAGERQTLQTTKLKGLISARGKATTTWGDIKEVQ